MVPLQFQLLILIRQIQQMLLITGLLLLRLSSDKLLPNGYDLDEGLKDLLFLLRKGDDALDVLLSIRR
jgi:hypothetical protein